MSPVACTWAGRQGEARNVHPGGREAPAIAPLSGRTFPCVPTLRLRLRLRALHFRTVRVQHCVCALFFFTLPLLAGVPVEVRDKALAKAAAAGAISTSLVPSTTQATSDVNRQYAIMQAEAARAENGGAAPSPFSTLATAAPQVHAALMGLGRHKAHYERNAAKLCSFFARGECTRGAACPYRHEMPKSSSDPLSKQSYEDRYYGTQDPVAAKLLARMEGREQAHSASSNNAAMDNDPAATTLWVGGVTPDSGITSDDLTYVSGQLPSHTAHALRCPSPPLHSHTHTHAHIHTHTCIAATANHVCPPAVQVRVLCTRHDIFRAHRQEGGLRVR
ncbi:MAG: zinc finger CCCH domain-containing protein [Methanobacteriota archaeon]|nr:MAG: zinc finger CCCH domain-containing protein [Euryarchaeota archaeon]